MTQYPVIAGFIDIQNNR